MSSNFIIGPIKDGIRKDIKPFAIPEDAFESMTNAYQFRGRILRRPGYRTLGRLANGTPVMGLRTREGFNVDKQSLIAFDTTDSYVWNGVAFIPLPSTMPVTWSGTDTQFFYTTNYAGAFWATNSKPGINGWNLSIPAGPSTTFQNSAGIGNLATVQVFSTGNNVQVGDYVHFINLASGVARNSGILAIVTVAGNPFTVQATNLPASSTFTWATGNSSTGMVIDSTQTIAGQDGIRYYGDLNAPWGASWANYNPPIDPNNVLAGALLIFPYRGYLVFLNTWEGNDVTKALNYGNRARWTQIGTPYYSPPVPVLPAPQTFDINAVRDDLFGRGGANDAPTNEVIVSAGFVRDILVVYFERSVWCLRFVNNSQNPFVWERVNIELGGGSTFSAVAFDKGLMSIGDRGIVISDANQTNRFDEKIPDEVFSIRQKNSGESRVYGIRTFKSKLVYWTFPDVLNTNGIYPDKVLVYNYESQTWSFFDDCFTCFGYFYPTESPDAEITWNDLPNAWASYTDVSWDSSNTQVLQEEIIAGNQQGYVFQLEFSGGQNGPSLSISAITLANPGVFTSMNNNLPDGTWITLTGITGTTSADGVSLNGRNFKVVNPGQVSNTFTLTEFKPINGGQAVGTSYIYDIDYQSIFPGSIQINIGTLVFKDTNSDGILYGTGGSGTINYDTGRITLSFNPAILSTTVWIRLVTQDPLQGFDEPVETITAYTGGGEITKISNFDIRTKYFNFFGNDQKARLSKIDFYTNLTALGQFTCNVFADSSNVPANVPLSDNLLQNVVLTTRNPYQIAQGSQTIYRLFCDCVASTLQLQLTLTDQQQAVNNISKEDLNLLSLMFSMRKGGRLI